MLQLVVEQIVKIDWHVKIKNYVTRRHTIIQSVDVDLAEFLEVAATMIICLYDLRNNPHSVMCLFSKILEIITTGVYTRTV